MAIEITKPQPMKVGDSYVYTLSSYEPVEATIRVPLIDDEEVRMGARALLAQAGQNLDDVSDEWISENMSGVKNKEELFKAIREQLTHLNEDFKREQKANACMVELIGRLEQSVATDTIEELYVALRQDYLNQLANEGMTEQEVLDSLEGGQEIVENTLKQEAKDIASYDAALDAYIKHNNMTLDVGELPKILNQTPEQVDTMLNAAKEAGVYDKVLGNALRAKALYQLLDEMKVTYDYETEEQAKERRANAPKFEV